MDEAYSYFKLLRPDELQRLLWMAEGMLMARKIDDTKAAE